MSGFPTINSLPASDQQKLREINAKSAGQRTDSEAAYLASRLQYLTNEILEEDTDGNILSARGNTIPQGYEGFAKGAEFIELDAMDGTETTFVNVGNETSADWLPQGSVAEDTPVNSASASGIITFSDVVSDGEIVVIGSDTYEFDTNSDVGEGNIPVDVSGSATSVDASTALTSAVNTLGTEDVVAVDRSNNMDTFAHPGAAGNSIAVSTTCANAAWNDTPLAGGVDGTLGRKGEMRFNDNALYICIADNGVDGANWRHAGLANF